MTDTGIGIAPEDHDAVFEEFRQVGAADSAAADASSATDSSTPPGNYLTAKKYSGVWLSDRPLDENEEAHGEVLLSVELPATVVAPYEWT